MIRAVFQSDGSGRYVGYTVRGHAGYAPEGEDIVCAAASSLAISCCNALETVAGIKPEAHMADGDLTVRIGDDSHDAQVILRVLRQGLLDLQEQYPRYITVNESK